MTFDTGSIYIELVPASLHRLYDNLVKKTLPPESEQGCWVWTGQVHNWYPQFGIRRNGRVTKLRAHRAMLVLMECQGEMEHFWDLYDLYSAARFDADHSCYAQPLCICPDHLQWLETGEHSRKTRTYAHPDSRRHNNEN